ncbi:MAG: hypothetical protein G01um101433_320 [Parcubacteria group bacterium Gr01-1014_33]|nr:MAG: hypothetical protein G01um101433_320 [Parcubacteria group bacterium Gr01-1014_33]
MAHGTPKTIFITSFHPLILRNIFSTELLEILRARGVRPIALVPGDKQKFFQDELKGCVQTEGVKERLEWRDFWLRTLALASINTRSLDIKWRTELKWSSAFFLSFIFSMSFGQRVVRTLSSLLVPRFPFSELLARYSPGLVFSTDIQNEYDVRMCHAARDLGILVIGMVRSWDTLTTKGLLQIIPDILIVQNEIQAKEAVTLHHIPEERVHIVGIPHYDRYQKESRAARESFFSRIGGDSQRPLILFAPVGDRYLSSNTVDRDVLQILDQTLPPQYQILVRYPPDDHVSFLQGKYRQNEGRILFDKPRGRQEQAGTNEELTRDNDMHLADTLHWSDLVVCGPSTICIDAAFFDTPVILVGFDGYEERPYFESIRRYFDYNHWQPILESGGVKLARGADECASHVKKYLNDPTCDFAGRERIVREQAYRRDGMATERLARILLSYVGNA